MSYLIKKHDVIETVYKALRTPPLRGVFTDSMSLAISMVNELPTIGAWTPCAEKMPERDERVLICFRWGDLDIGWWNIDPDNLQYRWHTEECTWYEEEMLDIVAWMPLPNPYKIEEDKNESN